MIGDLTGLVLSVCFLAGCAVRVWRAMNGSASRTDSRARVAEARLRATVRRPAVEVPVDGAELARPPAGDPLLPTGTIE